jgi:hypothetical protein
MKNRKQTSERITELAAKTLGDPRASKKSKALAGSALAQARSTSRSKHKARAAAA